MYELEPSPRGFEMIQASTQRLIESIVGLTDTQVRQPTALPGWSRAHVLSHLAAQVSGLERLLGWAVTGRRTPQYTSRAARDAEIEQGSKRSAVDLVDDVATSAARLQDGFLTLPGDAWRATIQPFTGEVCTSKRILVIRLRELEVHHVDLELGHTFADAAPDAMLVVLSDVAGFLDQDAGTPEFAMRQSDDPFRYRRGTQGPVVRDSGATLAGWLTGRPQPSPPRCSDPQLPDLPRWL